MQELPLLVVTQDPVMWRSWQKLAPMGWRLSQGLSLHDLQSWKSARHHLVMIDSSLQDLPTWNDAAWSKHFEALKVLVLSAHPSDAEGQMVLAMGASGYAHAHLAADALSRILKSIEDGAIWMGRSLLQKLLQDIDDRLPPTKNHEWSLNLSHREAEVAQLAALGHSNADIAKRLSITERTIRAHLSAIFEKLHVTDRLQLALKVHGIKA